MAPRVTSRPLRMGVALSLMVLLLGVADARPILPPDVSSPKGPMRLPTALANPTAVDISKLPQYPRAGVFFFKSKAAAIAGSVSLQVPPPGMIGQPLQKTSVQYTITVGWDVLQVNIVAADQPLYLNQQKIPPGTKSSPVYLVGQVTIISVLATTAQDIALQTYVIYVYRPGAPPGQELPPAPPVGTPPGGGNLAGGSTSPPAIIIPGAPSPPSSTKTPTATRKPRPPRTSAPVSPPGGSPSQGAQTPPPGATSGPSNPVPAPVSTPGGSSSPGSTSPTSPSSGTGSTLGATPGPTPGTSSGSGTSLGGSGSGGKSTPAPSSGGSPNGGGGSPPGGSTGGTPGSGGSVSGPGSAGNTSAPGSGGSTSAPGSEGSTSAPGSSGTGTPGSVSGGGTNAPPGSGGGGTSAPTGTGGGSPDSGSASGGSPGTGGQGTGSGSPTEAPGSGTGTGTGSSNGGGNTPGGSGSGAGGGSTPSPSSTSNGGSPGGSQTPSATQGPPGSSNGSGGNGGSGSGGTPSTGAPGSSGGGSSGGGGSTGPPGGNGGEGGTGSPSPGGVTPAPTGTTGSPGHGTPGSTPSQSPQGGSSGPSPEQGVGGTSSPGGGGSTPSPGASNSPGGTGSPEGGSPPGGNGGANESPPGGNGTPPGESGGSGNPAPTGNGGGSGSGGSPPDGMGGTGSPGSAPGGSGTDSPPGDPSTNAPGSGGSPTLWPTPPTSTAEGPASGPSGGGPTDSAGQPGASPGSGDGTGGSPGAPGGAPGAEGPSQSPSVPGGPICVGACNPGGGAEIIVTGQAFDSYLQSCTTFVDLNGNGIPDSDEPSGMTDLFGQFNISTPVYAPLVLLAGGECTDAATGVLLPGTLSAPPGATVITPLTTLVNQLSTRRNLEAATAERLVAEGLGLNVSAALTLTATDVIAAVLANQDGDAARVVVQNTRAQNVAAMAAALLSAGGDRSAAAAATFGTLADAIWALQAQAPNGTAPASETVQGNGTNGTSGTGGTESGSGTSEGNGTASVDAQLATEGGNDTTGGSSPGAGQASVQLRRLLGMLSEVSPGGSIGNLESTRTVSGFEITVEDGCKEGDLERRPHCLGRLEAGISGLNAEEETISSRQGSETESETGNVVRQIPGGLNGRKLRRLLQDASGSSNTTAGSPADLTAPVFLGSVVERAYQLLSNTSVGDLQPVTSTNDSTSGAPSLSADDFALAASAMGVANGAMDAPLDAFLQLNLAGNTNRSAAIEFLNEIWRRAKVAQSGFADVLVQLGAGEINRTAAAAALTPAAFQTLVANTTLLVSSGGEQALLQAQTGAPPPPGVIELPGSEVGGKHRAKSWVWIVIGVAVGVGGLLLCCCCGGVAYYCYRKKKNRRTGHRGADPEQGPPVSPRRWPWSPRPVASSAHSPSPTIASPDVASPVESPPVSPGAILRSHSIALPPNTHLLPVAAQAETAREAPPGGDETPQETAFSTPRSGISSDADV